MVDDFILKSTSELVRLCVEVGGNKCFMRIIQKLKYIKQKKSFEYILKWLLVSSFNISQLSYFKFSNNVLAANFPNSLEANGLAPVINFLSTQTVLSDSVFTIVTPRFLSRSLTPAFICPGK